MSNLTITKHNSKRFGGVGAPKITKRTRKIQGLVIHTTEGHEKTGSARNTCAWWDNPAAKGNAHYVCDDQTIIQFIPDDRAAWHATAANQYTIGIEICGKAGQTQEQWYDEYSIKTLINAAKLCAKLCVEHDIEVRKLTHAEIQDIHNRKSDITGFLGHVDVRDALKSGSHWDPGPNFPWLDFLYSVLQYKEIIEGKRQSTEIV